MLRVKVPAGQLTRRRAAHDRRGLEPLRQGRRRALDAPEHPAALARARASSPTSSPHLERAGVTTAGGCGDTVRNITGCPVQGIAADELFDASPTVVGRGRPLLRQPRLGEPAAQAQVLDLCLRRPLQRARDQLHLADRDAARGPRGVRGARRRRALVGAADRARRSASSSRRRRRTRSSARSPRSGRRTSRYRVSRVKARLKFMVDDIGPEGIRERVEARLGRRLEDYTLPAIDVEPSHHLGVHAAEAGRALLHRRSRPPRPRSRATR